MDPNVLTPRFPHLATVCCRLHEPGGHVDGLAVVVRPSKVVWLYGVGPPLADPHLEPGDGRSGGHCNVTWESQ